MPNEKGETRRELYDRLGEEGIENKDTGEQLVAPELDIPFEGSHLWEWYHDLSNSVARVKDGVCCPIPPSEFIAWKEMNSLEIRSHEYKMLRAMDEAFCAATNVELAEYRERTKPQ